MMNSLVISLAIATSVCAFLIVLFKQNNRRMRLRFQNRRQKIEQNLELHEVQIERRGKGLDRYDFVRYNLGEALVVQPEIKI